MHPKLVPFNNHFKTQTKPRNKLKTLLWLSEVFGDLNIDCVCTLPCLQMLDGSMSACEEGDGYYDQKSYCKRDDKYVGEFYEEIGDYVEQEQVHG